MVERALVVAAAVGVAACARDTTTEDGAAETRPPDPMLAAELERIAGRRILFGHQSVGRNVIQGLRSLAGENGVALHVGDEGVLSAGTATFLHVGVSENGDPLKKLESFASALAAVPAPPPEIAFLKLCFADIRRDTDAAALFARYRQAISELRARHPGTIFVHVTTPLTTVGKGRHATLKRLLGREPAGATENIRREAYNELMRETYRGREPLFDLALVESTRPDGTPERVTWNATSIPALAPAYAADEGHLNREGQRRVARQLISVLAALPASERATATDAHR